MNKQIEEMTKIICQMYRREKEKKCAGVQDCDCKCLQYNRCEALFNMGYRKTTDVAREIFAELETVLYKIVKPSIRAVGIVETKIMDGFHIRIEDYNAIKKKYESEGEE